MHNNMRPITQGIECPDQSDYTAWSCYASALCGRCRKLSQRADRFVAFGTRLRWVCHCGAYWCAAMDRVRFGVWDSTYIGQGASLMFHLATHTVRYRTSVGCHFPQTLTCLPLSLDAGSRPRQAQADTVLFCCCLRGSRGTSSSEVKLLPLAHGYRPRKGAPLAASFSVSIPDFCDDHQLRLSLSQNRSSWSSGHLHRACVHMAGLPFLRWGLLRRLSCLLE